MDLKQLSKNLGTAITAIETGEILNRAVLENQAEILDLNTAQLEKGKNSLDELLQRYASDEYAKFKKAIGSNAPSGVPNLKLEGDFYSGFKLERDGEDWMIFSTDEKNDELVNKYGSSIFGLSEKSITELLPNLLETLLTDLRQILQI